MHAYMILLRTHGLEAIYNAQITIVYIVMAIHMHIKFSLIMQHECMGLL